MGDPEPIESILARCLLDPRFLDGLRHDAPRALRIYALAPEARRHLEAMDWGRVRAFSGFIGKVQHNYLWEWFPSTRWLITFYGLDHELFADYRAVQLTPAVSGAPRAARAAHFLDFAAAWIDRDSRALRCPALPHVMAHERATWEVRASGHRARLTARRSGNLSSLPWAEFQRLVLRPASLVRVHRFRHHPLRLIQAIADRQFDRLAAAPPVVLTYWFDRAAGRERVAAVDDAAALLLSRIDGVRSVRAIIASIRPTLGPIRPVDCRALFETILALGIVGPQAEG